MTINYVATVYAVIEYDGKFVDHTYEDTIKFVDDLIKIAQKNMNEYGFKTAYIKDAETYDTLVSLVGDWQDETEYDDDFDDYDREYEPECSGDL